MSFSYNPISKHEAEASRYQLLKDGEYPAVVVKMTAKISHSGNNMIEAVLDVYDNNGHGHSIFDYLVFTPSMQWKCIHFCESAGLLKEYENGTFKPEMGEQRNIRVRISTRKGEEIPTEKLNGKAPGAKYPDKNVIEDYIALELKPKTTSVTAISVSPLIDDDLPF